MTGDPAGRIPARSPTHWLLVGLAPTCIVVLVVLGAFVEPSASGHGTHTQFGLPECKVMAWWGLPCPGCGVTTSVSLAAHGRILAALVNQPLGLAVALGMALYPLWTLASLFRGRDLERQLRRLPPRTWLVGGGALVLVSWLYKLATGFAA